MTTATLPEVCLGPVASVPPGEGRAFRVEGHAVAVFRHRNGDLYAVQNACPHANGPLSEGIAGGGTVICPLHARKFNLATGACLNDASLCLKTYAVRQEDGLLYVAADSVDTPDSASF